MVRQVIKRLRRFDLGLGKAVEASLEFDLRAGFR